MLLPLAGEGFKFAVGVGVVVSFGTSFPGDILITWELILSDLVFVMELEEKPEVMPPIVIGLLSPPGGGDLIKPPIFTSCLGGLLNIVGLLPRSTLAFCFALLISDIHAGC